MHIENTAINRESMNRILSKSPEMNNNNKKKNETIEIKITPPID